MIHSRTEATGRLLLGSPDRGDAGRDGVARFGRCASRAIAAALSCCALGATAQSTGSSPQSSDATLGEIRVRSAAERRDVRATESSVGALGDLPLIETPFSINVITRALLDNQQAAIYGDYLKNDPSVQVGNVAVGFFSLRGLSVGRRRPGLPVRRPAGHVALSDARYQLIGFERVEVLKGPSAFLSGLGGSSSLGGTRELRSEASDRRSRCAASASASRRARCSARMSTSATASAPSSQFGYRLNVGVKDGEPAVDRSDCDARRSRRSRSTGAPRSNLLLSAPASNTPTTGCPRTAAVLHRSHPACRCREAPDASRNIALSWDDVRGVGKSAYLRADWTFVQRAGR